MLLDAGFDLLCSPTKRLIWLMKVALLHVPLSVTCLSSKLSQSPCLTDLEGLEGSSLSCTWLVGWVCIAGK